MSEQALQMHAVLMSVIFGVALAFFVHGIRQVNTRIEWFTAFLTLAIVVCVWWWYGHLGAIFPSEQLHDYGLDFLFGVCLCIMASNIASAEYWTKGLVGLSATTCAKLVLVWHTLDTAGMPDDAPPRTPDTVQAATVAVVIVLLLAIFGLRSVLVQPETPAAYLKSHWPWVHFPVALGIVVSGFTAYYLLSA